jgi:hypothetical protein
MLLISNIAFDKPPVPSILSVGEMPPANLPWQAPVVVESYQTIDSRMNDITRRVSSRTRLSKYDGKTEETLGSQAQQLPPPSKKRRRLESNRWITSFRAVNVVIWIFLCCLLRYREPAPLQLSTLQEATVRSASTVISGSTDDLKKNVIGSRNSTSIQIDTEHTDRASPKFIHIIHTR